MTHENKIRSLEQERRDAMVAADVETLEGLFSEDLVWIHATARVDTKEGLLSSIASGSTKYESIRVEDETVRFVGGVALVSGLAYMAVVIKGEQRQLENRFTIIWASTPDGSAQVVNWQSTSVRK